MAKVPPFKASTLAEWKQFSRMQVTCSSGAKIELRPLTLDELAANEALPDDLLRVALLEQIPGGVVAEIHRKLELGDEESLTSARELSEANRELRDRLVLAAVVSPKLTAKDVAALDPFDKAEIAEFASRRRTVDAAGKKVGADALDTFRDACRVLARSETDKARKSLLRGLADIQ